MSLSANTANGVLASRVPLTPFDGVESPIWMKAAEKKPLLTKAMDAFKRKWAYVHAGWDYTDKSITLARRFFGVILHAGEQFADVSKSLKDSEIDVHFKFLACINIPFDLASVPSKIKTIWKSIQWKDKEATAHSVVMFTMAVADLFDSVVTSLSAALEIYSRPAIDWIASSAAPLGISLSSATILIKGCHLYQISKFDSEINRKILAIQSGNGSPQQMRRLLSPFLQKHLGTGGSGKKLEASLERHTSAEVLDFMKKIAALLDDGDDHAEEILELLEKIQEALKDEKKLQGGLLVAATVSTIAWSLFLTPVAPAAPFILLAVNVAMQIGFKVNHSQKQKKRQRILRNKPRFIPLEYKQLAPKMSVSNAFH